MDDVLKYENVFKRVPVPLDVCSISLSVDCTVRYGPETGISIWRAGRQQDSSVLGWAKCQSVSHLIAIFSSFPPRQSSTSLLENEVVDSWTLTRILHNTPTHFQTKKENEK